MKIDQFRKLEKRINGETFNEGYRSINNVLTVLSYFGHVASIFLAYFMLSKVISGAITDNFTLVFISTVILLGGVEYLKREIFDKFSIQFIKVKSLTKQVLPLFFLSILVISMSFYATISGANEFSHKGDEIEKNQKEVVVNLTNDIRKESDSLISIKNNEIKLIADKIEKKDSEQTDLAVNPTRSQLKRISDLKSERDLLRKDKEKVESEISEIKKERDAKIKDSSTEVLVDATKMKEDNSKNSFIFIIISSLIEIIILAGVFFGQYYIFRSYKEYRNRIERDPRFKKWELYDQMLELLYNDDTKINQKLPSMKSIIDMCKVNDIIILNKDMTDFVKVLVGLGIIKSSGSAKYIAKPLDMSKELLMNHFNVE